LLRSMKFKMYVVIQKVKSLKDNEVFIYTSLIYIIIYIYIIMLFSKTLKVFWNNEYYLKDNKKVKLNQLV